MMNFKKLTICVLSCFILVACSENGVIEHSVASVDLYQLPEIDYANERTFKGIAKAHDLVELSFRVEGRIAKIPVSKGQFIKQGDVLAQLDKTDYQVALNDRKAKQEQTKNQHKRAKSMLDKKLMAQSEYDKIRAEYLVANAQLKMAELELEYTTLKAPFDGIVGDVFLDSFENVRPGISVLSTHRIDLIEVNVEVPDTVLVDANREALVTKKRHYDVIFEAYPDRVFEGTMLELNIQKDHVTRTYIATLTVPIDPDYKVLEGMPATINVELPDLDFSQTQEYLLPVNAVISPDGGKIAKQEAIVWVYDEKNKTVSSQPVKLGTLIGDMIEVSGELKGGQFIISNGASRLVEGQAVAREEG